MSAFYKFSIFEAPAVAKPVGKTLTVSGTSFDTTGFYTVEIPDFLGVPEAATAQDLVTAKHAAMLASRPGYTNIVYDDMLVVPSYNATLSNGVQVGAKSGVRFGGGYNITPFADSSNVYVTSTVTLGSSPTQFVLGWESVNRVLSDALITRTSQTTTVPSSNQVFAQVSFQNGANPLTVTDPNVTVPVPPASQGTQLRISFTAASSLIPPYLTAWSICL